MPFIGETNSNVIFGERPEFLDQPIVEFFRPFPCEKGDNLGATAHELRTIAPSAVRRVGERHPLGSGRLLLGSWLFPSVDLVDPLNR
jgi:hypothetical protein